MNPFYNYNSEHMKGKHYPISQLQNVDQGKMERVQVDDGLLAANKSNVRL